MKHIAGREWYSRINDSIILGALPLNQYVPTLIEEEKVSAVLSCNHDWELRQWTPNSELWRDFGVRHLQIPIFDVIGIPTLQQIESAVAFINENIELGNTVYVHCKAGRSRSATILACYFVKYYGLDCDEAVEFIKNKRPHVWFGNHNLTAIKNFAKVLSES